VGSKAGTRRSHQAEGKRNDVGVLCTVVRDSRNH